MCTECKMKKEKKSIIIEKAVRISTVRVPTHVSFTCYKNSC